MKKISTIIMIVILTCSSAIAGNIYSNDETVDLYIEITEVTKDHYSFSLCAQNGLTPCSQLGKGFLVQKDDVLKIAKRIKRKGHLNTAIAVGAGIALIGGGAAVGLGVAAAATVAITGSGLAGGVVGAAGLIAGMGAGIASETSLVVTRLRPGSYKRLGNALQKAIETDQDVTIKRKDIYGLSTILEKQLVKFL